MVLLLRLVFLAWCSCLKEISGHVERDRDSDAVLRDWIIDASRRFLTHVYSE